MTEPNATQVIAGSGIMFVAPVGSALPAIDEPAPLAAQVAFSQAAGGALAARTVFVKITGVINGIESPASVEASFAALANNLVTVTFTLDNRPDAQYDHINVYASTSTGTEVKQTNGTGLVVTAGVATWTEPVTGVAGAGAPPTVVSGEVPVAWPSAWQQVGYTDSGIDIDYAPTVKDITVDEEMAPVSKILTAEKFTISATLAEATLLNLNRAISASVYSDDTTTSKSIAVKVGSGSLNFVMVGVQGPGENGATRVIVGYKMICQAPVKLKLQRKDKQVIAVQFEGVADSSKPVGQRLFQVVDVS